MKMIANILKDAAFVTNPLVLVALALLLIFGIHKLLIRSGIIKPLSQRSSHRAVELILRYGFLIALVLIGSVFSMEAWKLRLDADTSQQQDSSNVSSGLPSFEGQLGPYEWEEDVGSFSGGRKFNEFILVRSGEVVHLNVWFNQEQHEEMISYTKRNSGVEASLFEPYADVLYFFVRDSYIDKSGVNAEYLVNVSDGGDFSFDGRPPARRLTGFFKVVGVSGPRQGVMSVGMKPVDMENALIIDELKKGR